MKFPVGFFLVFLAVGAGAAPLAYWDFAQGGEGWALSNPEPAARRTAEGWVLDLQAPDPGLTGPPVDCPAGQFVVVTWRMRSSGDPLGQLYFGADFAEERSRVFVVNNDGQWHDYRIALPPQGPGTRFRLDPCHGAAEVGLAWIRLETEAALPAEPWARPQELRGKKFIGSGQYANGGSDAVNSRFLAQHPEFTASYPYNGLVVPVVIGADWAGRVGLSARDYLLQELLWNTVDLPYEALQPAVADLQSVVWGSVKDNFLNVTLVDGAKGRGTPDLANDGDWAILERQASRAARLCREAKLLGFWLDTEQYGEYRWHSASGEPEQAADRPAGLPFPFGKDAPEVLRRRGAQWIRAVQAELPAVKIIITFAWSPDAVAYGPLKGTAAFLDGVLEAMAAPGQLIHGYENTFYYGQGAGTTHTAEGFVGDRNRYETARLSMRQWRSYSANPAKYDAFVKVGMAAWVEDDPWNSWAGYPSGTKASFWSNLPLALAYSDEYVWVWSEHTHYGQKPSTGVNPFLASLRNQTGDPSAAAAGPWREDFATDPLGRGWYFDFDMLAIGRLRDPSHAVPLMSEGAVPYRWLAAEKGVRIEGSWPAGGPATLPAPMQRRRYVHAVPGAATPVARHASLDFRVESFGSLGGEAIQLGWFSSQKSLRERAWMWRLEGPERVAVVLALAGTSRTVELRLSRRLEVGQAYRVGFEFDPATRRFQASLREVAGEGALLGAWEETLSEPAAFDLDELGAALAEPASVPGSAGEAYRYRLEGATFR